jgi:hypothetical protein
MGKLPHDQKERVLHAMSTLSLEQMQKVISSPGDLVTLQQSLLVQAQASIDRSAWEEQLRAHGLNAVVKVLGPHLGVGDALTEYLNNMLEQVVSIVW